MGLWLVGRRPVLSKGGYSNSSDRTSPSRSCARALHDSASVASWHLTYELLRNRLESKCGGSRNPRSIWRKAAKAAKKTMQ